MITCNLFSPKAIALVVCAVPCAGIASSHLNDQYDLMGSASMAAPMSPAQAVDILVASQAGFAGICWPLEGDCRAQENRFARVANARQGLHLFAGRPASASRLALASDHLGLYPQIRLDWLLGQRSEVAEQALGGVKIRFGLLTSGPHPVPASQDDYPPLAGLPEVNAEMLEVSKSFGNAALSVSMSRTREWTAYLDSYPGGALSLGPRVSTSALQVSGAFMIAPKLAIAGQASYDVTPEGRYYDGLIAEASRARTNTVSFALVAADQMRRGDRLSVSLSQPMRAYSGRIMTDVLPRSSGNGQASERLIFSMVPIGRSMRVQLNYQMPAGYGATFGMSLIVRRNPNRLDDAPVETLVAIRYMKSF